MGDKKKKGLLTNVALLGIVQIANYAMPLISVPIISRIIGPEKFGIINYAASFITYFTLLIGYGFDFTAIRILSKDPSNEVLRSEVFSKVFVAQCLLFIVSAVLFITCLFLVPTLTAEKKVVAFSFFICIASVLTQNWLFQAMQDLSKVALMNFVGKLVFTVAVLLAVRKSNDYLWQPFLTSLVQILIAIVSFVWAYKTYNIKIIRVTAREIYKILWDEKIVFFSIIVITLYTNTNVVMLGLMKNQTQVGFYTAGQKLILIITAVISTPLSQSMYPYIGSALAESRDYGITLVQKIIPFVVVVLGIVSLVTCLFGPIALRGFYGAAFLPSIPALRIMAFVPLVIAMANIFGVQIMLNLGMDRAFLRITACGGAIGLVLNYFMTKYFGYVGTAWNWLIVEIFITSGCYLTLRHNGINPVDVGQFSGRNIYAQLKPFVARLKSRRKPAKEIA